MALVASTMESSVPFEPKFKGRAETVQVAELFAETVKGTCLPLVVPIELQLPEFE